LVLLQEDEDSNSSADLTRALIKHFPRLLTRYQGEATQLADILAIPRLMHLETYLDLRMVPVRRLDYSSAAVSSSPADQLPGGCSRHTRRSGTT
jgi:hypothetical protein